ncbi:unnamed protein product [Staurois parvus]|uniref:Uncharacterized protein n=1 Tax=Staurois parvus TaxID=386267 RepID=A0ABN9EPU9_9NEOB|nr:unnamed protein product [Staurois parvus]
MAGPSSNDCQDATANNPPPASVRTRGGLTTHGAPRQ